MLKQTGMSRRSMAIMEGVLGAALTMAGSSAFAAASPGSTLDPFTLRTTTIAADGATKSAQTLRHTIRIPARPTARSAFRPAY